VATTPGRLTSPRAATRHGAVCPVQVPEPSARSVSARVRCWPRWRRRRRVAPRPLAARARSRSSAAARNARDMCGKPHGRPGQWRCNGAAARRGGCQPIPAPRANRRHGRCRRSGRGDGHTVAGTAPHGALRVASLPSRAERDLEKWASWPPPGAAGRRLHASGASCTAAQRISSAEYTAVGAKIRCRPLAACGHAVAQRSELTRGTRPGAITEPCSCIKMRSAAPAPAAAHTASPMTTLTAGAAAQLMFARQLDSAPRQPRASES
jgi:hypothetical protein